MPAAPSHLRPDLRAAVTGEAGGAGSAENRPGVYLFTGPRGEILYVGKSVRVRTRLLGYFRGTAWGKEGELLRTAAGVRWEYAPNEFEALVREFRLIRRHRPRFNVRHRRDRRFAWVRLTRGAAPRLVATRSPRPDGSRFFGPFPAGRRLPDVLRELAHATGLRDCPDATPMHFADQLDLLAGARTPGCLRAGTGSCSAPCAALCTTGEYRARVDEAVAFLEGRTDAPLDRLRDRLRRAAEALEYEQAARIRDRIQRLEGLRERIVEFRRYLDRLTCVYRVDGAEGDGPRHYLLQGGRVRLTWHAEGIHELPHAAPGPDDTARGRPRRPGHAPSWSELSPARLEHRLREATEEPAPDPTFLAPGEREELFLVAGWFRQHPDELERTQPVEDLLAELKSSQRTGGVTGPSVVIPASSPAS